MGAILDKIKDRFRMDGYINLLNRYGTSNDVSEHYEFEAEQPVADVELTVNYEGNGLFAKIIDIPADDAASGEIELGIGDKDIETFINDSLDELECEEKIAEALKWSRLYGGAIIVMMIDDGGGLTDPVDWDNIHGIDELIVFERPLVTPDYNSIYNYRPGDSRWSKFGMPEYYDVSPMYGSPFRVHESRCLLFRNGSMPQSGTNTEYRFFGIPEYIRIQKALQETVTSHGNGVKLLDRAVQAIYKMENLAQMLETEQGEDMVLRRLEIIDMAKGIINSIAIDKNEDYDYKTVSFTGVKDIIDSTCNMLSAVTNIPQTKLFGRSPAGENSTGEGDMENYYTYVGKIQKLNLKKNMGVLIDVVLQAGRYKGEFEEVPDYKLAFKPLWSMSDSEQADVDQKKAATELTKAQTAQVYVDMQALDASEVRKRLAEDGEFTVNDILDEGEVDWNSIEAGGIGGESEETSGTALSTEQDAPDETADDSADVAVRTAPMGCGVIVIKDGRILAGTRKDNGLTCGPGGHIEPGETPEEAAIRETREEFGIYAANIIPLAVIDGMPDGYCPSQTYLCTEFYGEPVCFNDEMKDARFMSMAELHNEELFLPFELSIKELVRQLANPQSENIDGGPGSGRKPEGEKEVEPLKNSENSGIIASAKGANSLEVKGFKSSQHLNNHWLNGRTHQEEYAKDGITTKEQYAQRAVELAEMPVGGTIQGYKTKEGYVCRYDTSKNDYVKADIKKGIRTMFKPEDGEKYYQEELAKEGIEDD
jgi:phage-related protein (TIGR01555 family)